MGDVVWSGPPELVPLLVPLDSVAPHPRNARQGDVGAMTSSLEAFGQYRAAIVQDSSGHVVAGSHLWRAVKALGWSHLAVIRRELTDQEAVQLMLADNRVADRGSYDQAALADLLEGLAHAGALTPATGYDPDDLDDLLADLGRVPMLPPGQPRAQAPRAERQEETPAQERVVSWVLPEASATGLLERLERLAELWEVPPAVALLTAVDHAAEAHL